MKKQILLSAIERISKLLFSYEYKCDARSNPNYFSREGGKIGFVNMIAITLNFLAKSIQKELNDFFEHVMQKTENVSKQAYSEARFKLTTDAFRIPYKETTIIGAEIPNPVTFKGYRILPVDGTTLALEDTDYLRSYYGVIGGEHGHAGARASVMVDVMNKGIVFDAQLDKYSVGENKFAMLHIDRLDELNIENPLLIFDRNYASVEMFEKLANTGFLFRIKRGFSPLIDRLPLGDVVMEITIKKKTFTLRILKFKLSTGEIETLVTNLPKFVMTTDDLKELYNLRWGVETTYRTLKGALEIENFSGTSQQIVEQDFFATMFLKNMVAFAKIDADAIVDSEKNEAKDNLHPQQVNESQLIGILKDKLVMALLETRPRVQKKKVTAIIREATRFTVPIRPGRSSPRKRRHNKRFCMSGKRVL